MRIRRRPRSDFVQNTCKEETCSQTYDNSVDMEGGLGQDDGMVTPLFGDVKLGRVDRSWKINPTRSLLIRQQQLSKHTQTKNSRWYDFGAVGEDVAKENIERKARHARKNYSHWTSDEVEALLNGVEEHGVGNWALIKRTYFKTFPRTAEHLKDKWRGLCRACGLQVGSKQKVKAQPATLEILKGFTYKIREMARKHDA
ncbi:unnamed protein product [Urochloa decumbens]|uniref:Myb-like domain-containing protein n=1 Tax=Urochloa decumbens TaxID=240449 RepID=A0ABC8WWF2_9POAL